MGPMAKIADDVIPVKSGGTSHRVHVGKQGLSGGEMLVWFDYRNSFSAFDTSTKVRASNIDKDDHENRDSGLSGEIISRTDLRKQRSFKNAPLNYFHNPTFYNVATPTYG